ncbi:MAG TPA: patatin-like phospholipase family protein [Patescibacteria group bacterium]|nr:patatin-like phospholipase family protein [Patescibacteria group bacterium]
MKNKIGLALGSGAFRGFAHIGVIQVLQENNIPISFISGTSVGALVAAYFALYQDISGLEEAFLSSKKNFYRIADLGWRNGLVSATKYERFIEHLLGNKNFKDVKIPLQILATELATGNPYVFSSGKLATAVRASSSVPIVFESIKGKNGGFVDGALSSPVPVKELIDLGADKVIAVNLYHKNEFIDKRFNLTKIALRSTRIVLYNLAQKSIENASTVINPDVSSQVQLTSVRNYFSRKLIDEMIQIGRRETKKKIKEIKSWL